MAMKKERKRTYQEPWEVLKTTGKVSMRVTGTTNEKIVAKYAKTYRKAMQKEKYIDEDFRKLHPNAKMTSTIEGNVVHFILDYGIKIELEDVDTTIKSTTKSDGGMI